MTKVLNKRKDKIPPDAIYVGRPSKWGNPIRIDSFHNRREVIRLYRIWLEDKIKRDVHYLDELKDHDLVCWCAPLPCHADVLLELANAQPVQPPLTRRGGRR